MNEIWSEIWKALVLIIVGMLVLRLAGRKSISQMTIPTTIAMISIGTIIVQPIADHSILITIVAAAVFIIVLIIVEWLQVRWNAFERLIKGPAVIVIAEGQLQPKNLRKLRLTVDELEMSLRGQGISRLSDVKTATIEPNGQLGYELQDSAKPVTMAQVEALFATYLGGSCPANETAYLDQPDQQTGLFDEIKLQ
ncbi:DUF421 domain-containing protein [Paenibacillus sp. FSL P2-0089]|uniref:Uncharacterized membrane protein YcaP (DUF421 family) n=1 Tax=Paenibacillus silagei TaxID=1670801 RepID=A0ABS4P0W2_9BACL|nr:DUF421 domain-containing protein [Paenibacillus silagei]MBP2115955.1 uncharacterized membrane protein YcaP (DUF421 family) [Paenibacillus silagei]